jgi:Phage holin T7 family, holin superfamily II
LSSGLDEADLDILVPMSPSVAVSAVHVFGVPLSEWVYVFTIIYSIVGIATIIRKHWITNHNKEQLKNDTK